MRNLGSESGRTVVGMEVTESKIRNLTVYKLKGSKVLNTSFERLA